MTVLYRYTVTMNWGFTPNKSLNVEFGAPYFETKQNKTVKSNHGLPWFFSSWSGAETRRFAWTFARYLAHVNHGFFCGCPFDGPSFVAGTIKSQWDLTVGQVFVWYVICWFQFLVQPLVDSRRGALEWVLSYNSNSANKLSKHISGVLYHYARSFRVSQTSPTIARPSPGQST